MTKYVVFAALLTNQQCDAYWMEDPTQITFVLATCGCSAVAHCRMCQYHSFVEIFFTQCAVTT